MSATVVTLIAALVWTLGADTPYAQSLTAEAAITAGASSDDVEVVATQLRAFGEVESKIRYYVEAAWARSSHDDSDAFGAAYPYGDRLQVIEAYGERMFQARGGIVGIRAGRYRTPFGIHNASDHAYAGFSRAPLVRYDGYFALSNNFLEHGADLIVGVPHFTVETSLGAPADVGNAVRRSGLDAVVRGQGALGPAIIGVSHSRTMPYQPVRFARGRAVFTGIDLRWMRDGVQLRGEWMTGRPFDGVSTHGWYADAIVHRLGMGPLTAVARIERLDYDTTPQRALHSRRQTVGARIRILDGLSAQVNVIHSTGQIEADEYRPTAFDIGVTYSRRLH